MKIGSLCSGFGGLDHAVEEVFGATVAWVSDVDKGACKILAHRYPDVPNIGDMTTVGWATLEPVDILTAGYPCQPFSHAGRRKGTNDVRHLWPYVREAVRVLRPRLTVLENVAGHRSLGFDRVLGDLAEEGLHVRWTSLRAADIGAPHGRERLFFIVTPDAADLGHQRGRQSRRRGPRPADGGSSDLTLLGTPRASEWKGSGPVGSKSHAHRLERDYLDAQVLTLLPTPTSADLKSSGSAGYNGNDFCTLTDATVRQPNRWGDYAAAIARWEHVLGRPAPSPTRLSTKGNPQLAADFVEWMMGLPAGWVTDVPGITRNEALKALGNGVVPAQAVAALRTMLAWVIA